MFPQVMPNGPDLAPWTDDEIKRWAHNRRPHERERLPHVGERLLLRTEDFGIPVLAEVVDVQDIHGTPHDHWNRHGGLESTRGSGIPDVNVWYWDPDLRRHRLKDDPWPWVQVKVIVGQDDNGDDVYASPTWCREARVRGSAGWLREGSMAHTYRYPETVS